MICRLGVFAVLFLPLRRFLAFKDFDLLGILIYL